MNDAVLSPAPVGTPGGPKVLLEVFGCQMNKLDAELMVGALKRSGYDFTDRDEEADAVLMVTCAIRDQAEHRVHSHLGELSRMKRHRPDLALGVLGCMAQREGQGLLERWPALDFVAGTRDFPGVADVLDEVRADRTRILRTDGDADVREDRDPSARPQRARAFVSVMRGCHKRCTYCVVPNTRGNEVSRPMEVVLDEIRALVDDGVMEITLLGQTVNGWGRREGRSLGELLHRLEELRGLHRVRFITSHPEEMDDVLIDAMAACGKSGLFLHLPFQSGSDAVLRRMARGYTAGRYRDIVGALRERVPGIEIGADVIVGFPGESEDDFAATRALMADVRLSQAYVFRYSPRPGTPAWGAMPDDVPDAEKRRRLAELNALQQQIMLARHEGLVGQVHEVLVEGASRRDPRRLFGRNLAFDRLVFEGDPALVDRFVDVEIREVTALTLAGRRRGEARDTPRSARGADRAAPRATAAGRAVPAGS